MRPDAIVAPSSRIYPPSLVLAVALMLACTLYPPMLTGFDGQADRALATALFAAMSVAFVRGVGFVPRGRVWRCLFSGRACLAALALAGVAKLLQ